MTQQQATGGRRFVAIAVAAALVIGAIVALTAITTGSEEAPDGSEREPSSTGGSASRTRDGRPESGARDRVRVDGTEPVDVESPAADDVVLAKATTADGTPLPGEPPPYTEYDATVPYHFIAVISADESQLLGTLLPDHEGLFALPAMARGRAVRLVAIDKGGGRWSEMRSGDCPRARVPHRTCSGCRA